MADLYSALEAQTYIRSHLRPDKRLPRLTDEQLEILIGQVIQADLAYIVKARVDQGEIYDDDDAYDFICEQVTGVRAIDDEIAMDQLQWVEAILVCHEEFLEEKGLVEWE